MVDAILRCLPGRRVLDVGCGTVARLLSPEGALIGLSYAPTLHESAAVE
jgi:hypothetical protein